MDDSYINYDDAQVTWEGPVRMTDEDPVMTYRMKSSHFDAWFVGDREFESNEVDYKIIIRRFGLKSKIDVMSNVNDIMMQFDNLEIEHIKDRIEMFFMNYKETSKYPYLSAKAKCIGVLYSENWICKKSSD